MGGKRKLEIRLPGAKTKYQPIYARQAYKLSLLGFTHEQLAKFFDVNPDAITEWIRLFPDFADAIKEGKDAADSNVAQSLYRRATGMKIPRVKIFNDFGMPLVVPYVEYIPPDVAACIIWLKNRQPDLWRESRFNKENKQPGNGTGNVVIFELPDNGRNEENTPATGLPDEGAK